MERREGKTERVSESKRLKRRYFVFTYATRKWKDMCREEELKLKRSDKKASENFSEKWKEVLNERSEQNSLRS
jgi:hypothetical protein